MNYKSTGKSVGEILQLWRKRRRYSQLQLALELDVSSKHISFIETGKSNPSKAMILKVSTFLNLPKGEVNYALNSAGYAPVYSELSASDKNLKPVFDAIEQMIESHMPYPAMVLDQSWNLVKLNRSAEALLTEVGYSDHHNLIEALISDTPKTSKILNWYEVVEQVVIRLRQEISLLGSPERLMILEEKLEKKLSNLISDSNKYKTLEAIDKQQIVIETRFKLKEGKHAYFSIMAQLGTVQDVTVSEYKVELMFPADEQTKAFYSV